MRPIFCRIGSKKSMLNRLLKKIPEHKTYVEPFVGGGALYFAKEPAEKEVINDLDKTLMRDYNLVKRSRDISKFPKQLNTIEKLQRFLSRKHTTPEEQLVEAMIRRCNGFGGRYITNKKVYHPSNPYTKLKKLEDYKQRLSNTIIKSADYKLILKQYDSNTTFFYLDPPYENSDGLYNDSSINLEELKTVLSKLKGKFLLSLNDSANVRRVFQGFKQQRFTLRLSGNVGKLSDRPDFKRTRKEILISNY